MALRIVRTDNDTTVYESTYKKGTRGVWESKYIMRGNFDIELPVILDKDGNEVGIGQLVIDGARFRLVGKNS